MGLRINTNVPALVAQRHLHATRQRVDRNLERLSSGSRINRAGDDAVGMAISELLHSQIRSLGQSERNAQDGISVIQVAEGSLAEISTILIRMRELAIQASSDTVGERERTFMNIEFQQSLEEIDRIANTTEFNHVRLLNGTANKFDVQIGTGNNSPIDRISLFDSNTSDVKTIALGINLASLGDKSNAQNSLDLLESAIGHVTAIRARFGATQNRLQSVIQNISVSRENLSAANSRIRDMDMAEEATELAKNQILLQTGVSVLSQANNSVKAALNLLTSGG